MRVDLHRCVGKYAHPTALEERPESAAAWPGASVDADGGRWVAARHLHAGDRLPRRSGEQATLTDVSVAPGRLHVYNLNVAEEHTYAVGKDSVLVHNQCPPNGAGASGGAGITAKIAEQMGPRGWTADQIAEAINSGRRIPAMNKATGNPAIRYVHPGTGQSVVVDTVTNEVIHVGGPGFIYGPASGDLP